MEYIVGLLSKRRESLPNELKIKEASHKNQPEDTTIVVIGLGFVGLACFAGFRHMGYTVYGIEKNDIRKNEIASLCGAWIETGVRQALHSDKNFHQFLLSDIKELPSLENAIYVICVGTPQDDSGKANLETLYSTIEELLKNRLGINVEITIKSTVPPGTTEHLETKYSSWIARSSAKKVDFIANPEFLREGYAYEDFIQPDRIVLGTNSNSPSMLGDVYNKHFDNLFVTNTNSAELSKYFSNCSLAVMISFANEIRLLGEKIGNIDNKVVFEQFAKDRRWETNLMKNYFWPGIGFGGYCLPKDTKALAEMYPNNKTTSVLKSAIDINDKLVEHFAGLIIERFKNHKRLVLCGSSFKVGSNDIRVSKTLELIHFLHSQGIADLALLEEPASLEIKNQLNSLEIVKEEEILPTDAIVIVLKDPSYKRLLSRVSAENLLNIPLL